MLFYKWGTNAGLEHYIKPDSLKSYQDAAAGLQPRRTVAAELQ